MVKEKSLITANMAGVYLAGCRAELVEPKLISDIAVSHPRHDSSFEDSAGVMTATQRRNKAL